MLMLIHAHEIGIDYELIRIPEWSYKELLNELGSKAYFIEVGGAEGLCVFYRGLQVCIVPKLAGKNG